MKDHLNHISNKENMDVFQKSNILSFSIMQKIKMHATYMFCAENTFMGVSFESFPVSSKICHSI